MTKKVNKKNAIVVVLVLLIVGLIYWAYASRPKVEETQNTQTNKVMVYHNNTLKEEVNGKLIWQCLCRNNDSRPRFTDVYHGKSKRYFLS